MSVVQFARKVVQVARGVELGEEGFDQGRQAVLVVGVRGGDADDEGQPVAVGQYAFRRNAV